MPPRSRSQSLLILSPPPPSPFTSSSINAAYKSTVTSVLQQAWNDKTGCILDIALPLPIPKDATNYALYYDYTQSIVAALYKLICVVAAQQGINVEDGDGVDVRVLIVRHETTSSPNTPSANNIGPVVELDVLARSSRPWSIIYSAEGEAGEVILKAFTKSFGGSATYLKVPGGNEGPAQNAATPPATNPSKDHRNVIVGGTWDHIHIGHKLLLTMFVFVGSGTDREYTIGMTGDAMLANKKYADLLESWEERKDSTFEFLKGIMDFRSPEAALQTSVVEINEPGPNGHAVHVKLGGTILKFVEIWDPYGPTITDESLTALVVSGETRGGGKAVNVKRGERDWPELEVFEVDVLDASEGESSKESFEAKLSSTTIRQALMEKQRIKSKA